MSKKILRHCERCGKPFGALPANVVQGYGKRCSRSCAASKGPNKHWSLSDGSVKIKLTRGKFAYVDAKDWPKVSKYRWWTQKCTNIFYASTEIRHADGTRSGLSMHTLIKNPRDGLEVDHKDGDGLNNRRRNMRNVTHRGNMQNYHLKIGKTSELAGVCLFKPTGRWMSRITIDGKGIYLGYFGTEFQAHKAYKKACRDLAAGCFMPPIRRTPTCKSRGVSLSPNGKRYMAQKNVNGAIINLGTFKSERAAAKAFRQFEAQLKRRVA